MTQVRPALSSWFLSLLPSHRRQIACQHPVAQKWVGEEVLPQGSTRSVLNWSLLGFCPAEPAPAQPQLLWLSFAIRLAVKSEAGC